MSTYESIDRSTSPIIPSLKYPNCKYVFEYQEVKYYRKVLTDYLRGCTWCVCGLMMTMMILNRVYLVTLQ